MGVFLLLIGTPPEAHVPHSRYIAMTTLLVLLSRGAGVRRGPPRPLVCCAVPIYGACAGTFYGTLGVMVDAASDQAESYGVHGLFVSPRGLVPLISVVLLGIGGLIMTQVSFQVGALAATLPANLAADPFTGVLIGALLLRERIPVDPAHLVGYAVCLAAVLASAIRLAEPATAAQPVPRAGVRMALW